MTLPSFQNLEGLIFSTSKVRAKAIPSVDLGKSVGVLRFYSPTNVLNFSNFSWCCATSINNDASLVNLGSSAM